MGRQLSPREREMRAALERLKVERGRLREQQRRVRAARRAVEAFNVCDWCGQHTLGAGLTPTLCHRCAAERAQASRVALLEAHGYGPDGKRLPRADRAAA